MRINSFGPVHKGPGQKWAGAALGGASLGLPGALLGQQLGRQLGPEIVEFGIRQAVPLLQAGRISPHTLLSWAPTVLNPVVQAHTGAVLLGCAGVLLGATLGAAMCS